MELAATPTMTRGRFFAMVAIGAAVSGLPSVASAGVTEYTAGRQVSYSQTSNAPPTTPDVWNLLSVLVNDVPGEVLSATISFDGPPPVTYSLIEATPTLHYYVSSYYDSEDEFLLDYPATTYTLEVDRGAGPESGDVFLPENLYCPEIPYLADDTYDRLQGYDPAQSFDGTINGFTLAPGTSVGWTNIVVAEEGATGAVLSITLPPEETQFAIPAGLLKPGTNYSMGISYLNVLNIPDAGFGNATAGAEFYRSTSVLFTTLAGPHHREIIPRRNRKLR